MTSIITPSPNRAFLMRTGSYQPIGRAGKSRGMAWPNSQDRNMSISNIQTTMERIRSAKPESPIAVFLCNLPCYVNTVFADTVQTRSIITGGSKDLVGVFHKENDLKEVESVIRAAINY